MCVLQVHMPDNASTMTQVNAVIEVFGLHDSLNRTGIAFALLQLWYYHYPIEEV
jgi:hypothetical protein